MPSLDSARPSPDRWPPLLLALRRAARPDRTRVAAYLSLTERSAGWAAYTEFLALHRSWIGALYRALVQAGLDAPGPLPDAAEPFEGMAEAASIPDVAGGLTPPRTRAEALGYLYVLEAFRLGCAVLARRVRGKAEAGAIVGPWNELVEALSGVPAEDHPATVQAAKAAYADWERRLAGSLIRLGLGLGLPSTEATAA